MKQQGKKIRIEKILPVLFWLALIVICFHYRDRITVEQIVSYTPHNPALAALVMMVFFALKSVSIVIYSGILYVVDGILFPIPVAILMNLCGTAVMTSIPYFLGRKTGASAVSYITGKYPKAEKLHTMRAENDFFFAFLVRIIGRIPSDILSLYMGAVGVEYRKYLLGSLLGMLPHMIIFPIMGMSMTDMKSPQFLISLCCEIVFVAASAVIYFIYRKKKKADKVSE